MTQNPLARLPSVSDILRHPEFHAASGRLANPYRTRIVRRVVERHRAGLASGTVPLQDPAATEAAVLAACVREAQDVQRPSPRRVINGTGVLIHTNFGRAPLGALLEAVDSAALGGYTDLEWDAATTRRGDRDAHLRRQMELLTGAEDVLMVNNCASALLLALNTLAPGRDVLVSRAELVEIGGSFRVPDIMQASGCRLVEVGTTNRTRIEDFERHARPGESVLLRVHQSNFVQRGFVERVPVRDLVALGARLGVPVVEDNGSGLLAADGDPALRDEPRVADSLREGVDVVCCSADKLFGAVQAGILLGSGRWIRAMRQNPLYRVLRLDKVRLALLGAAARLYLEDRAAELPLWRLYYRDRAELEALAARIRLPGPGSGWRSVRVVPLQARLGGGSSPEMSFDSLGLGLEHRRLSAEAVRRGFASRPVPVAGYVQGDRFHLDLRCLFPDDLPELQQALDALGAVGAE
jgi:L-seryl-tRNA(Ser) seleniumtransferase